VADGFSGAAEHVRKAKLHLLATRKQMSAVRGGEGGE
jgi:hypothetical protein